MPQALINYLHLHLWVVVPSSAFRSHPSSIHPSLPPTIPANVPQSIHSTKGGDREKATNYRSISILPATSKLMEKHVQLQLSSHVNFNSLLFPLQSGFCPSHSTQTLLLHCLDRWYKAFDQKKFGWSRLS